MSISKRIKLKKKNPKQPKTQKLGQQGKQILRTYLSNYIRNHACMVSGSCGTCVPRQHDETKQTTRKVSNRAKIYLVIKNT